jgi:hypothetical protein
MGEDDAVHNPNGQIAAVRGGGAYPESLWEGETDGQRYLRWALIRLHFSGSFRSKVRSKPSLDSGLNCDARHSGADRNVLAASVKAVDLKRPLAIREENVMTTVNRVQTTTYYLTSGNNPITFGTRTGIDVPSASGLGVYGSNVQSWAVTNKGGISGGLYGVSLSGGGSVTNKAGATISGGNSGLSLYQYNGYTYVSPFANGGGVRILGGAGTVTNAGKIGGAAFGVDLAAGGSVTNKAGATISGSVIHGVYGYYSVGTGILVAGGTGTVTNQGDITGFSSGAELQAGGMVTNSGSISGGFEGIDLTAGGSVTNKAGGTISGGGYGVFLSAGGSVTNEAGGTIDGFNGFKAFGVANMTNGGTIIASTLGNGGNAVTLYGGGSVVNEAGATIRGGFGVLLYFSAGTVTNAGDITGYISPGGNPLEAVGVDLGTGGSVTNEGGGTISGYFAGVALHAGSVTNRAGGAIDGYIFGIAARGSGATVTNAGSISGEAGVATVMNAAMVINSGVIAGTKAGSAFFAGTVPLGDGVFMNAGGSVTNTASGTITGAVDGVYLAGGGSVTNAGAISGTTASVQFAGASANTLTLETGSRLTGDAVGSTASGSTNALVLEGSGRANNNFDNFNTLTVQGGADWTLGGTSSFGAATISSGSSLDDAGALTLAGTSALAGSKIIISSDDTLTMNGATALSGKVLGAGTLAIAGGSATLNNGASLSAAGWTVSGSGTSVTLDENLSYAAAFSEGAGVTFVLSGGHLLSSGADTFAGGTVDGSNVLDTKGTTTLSGLTIGGTVEWENEGTVIQSGGSATIGDAGGDTAFLDNTSRGIYDITDDSGIGLGSSTASNIQNSGLLEKTAGTGTSAIAPAVTNTGTIEVTAGTIDLQGAVTGKGNDKVSGASTLEFDSAVVATQTVDFLGGPSAVDLIDPTAFLGRIADFASSNTVQLAGDWAFSGFSENVAGTLGTLTMASGASRHAFDFVGDYIASDFKITSGATTTIGRT